MALPTTLSNISTAVASVGPFKSSGGNYYVIGVDSSVSSTIRALKATDPSSSFSSIATNAGSVTQWAFLAAYQVGDVIHIAGTDKSGATSWRAAYITFDMSSDAFANFEVPQAMGDTRTSGSAVVEGCSLVVRSDGHVVMAYQGPRVASMGNSYSRIVAKRRTGVNTWVAADGVTNPTPLDAGGTKDYIHPECVLGSSDRTHFMWANLTDSIFSQRALTSANSLQTAGTISPSGRDPRSGVAYDDAGTTRVAVYCYDDANNVAIYYFDSGNTPSLNTGTAPTPGSSASGAPSRLFNDGTDLWWLGQRVNDSDLYAAKSTNDGATFDTPVSAFVGTINTGDANLSVDGNIYLRGSDYVIPYVVNDNGTLKYNEYVVRSVAATFIAKTYLTSQAVKRAAFW